jgi:uncharacterized membrane protein
MEELKNVKKTTHRIDGQLYETFIISDDMGKELQNINVPLKVELKIRDILEVIVGASILSIPVAFTEEVWNMGDDLHWMNIIALSAVSLLFLGSFIYYTSYLKRLELFRKEYYKRIFFTYFLSILVVGLLLFIVDKAPWFTDFDIALKRTIIGAFPASMSATVTDNIS